MPYDKYHYWPIRTGPGGSIPGPGGSIPGRDILNQVLQDLAETKDDIDRLEILDSFEAWVKRCSQAEMAEMMARQLIVQAQPFVQAGILGQFPPVSPIHRGRPAQGES